MTGCICHSIHKLSFLLNSNVLKIVSSFIKVIDAFTFKKMEGSLVVKNTGVHAKFACFEK